MGVIFICDVKASVSWSRPRMMMWVLRTEALFIFLILLGVNLNFCLKIPAFSFKVKGWRIKSIRKVQRAHMLCWGIFFEVALQHCPKYPIGQSFSHTKFWQRKFLCLCKKRRTDVGWQPAFPSTVSFMKALKSWMFFNVEFILKKYEIEEKALQNGTNRNF